MTDKKTDIKVEFNIDGNRTSIFGVYTCTSNEQAVRAIRELQELESTINQVE